MKKLFAFMALTALLVSNAYAEPQLNRRNVWRAKQFFQHDIKVGQTNDSESNSLGNDSVYVKGDIEVDGTAYIDGSLTAYVERNVPLPLASFITAGVPVTNATAPGIEIDDLVPALVWADGETTPALISFRVPASYSSGGAFHLFATESDSTTPNEVDFAVYINQDGLAADAAATNQTPVALDGVTSTGTEVTLTVATDFTSLAAGDWVTLSIWRDNTAAGTGDLEVKGVEFYFTATQ